MRRSHTRPAPPWGSQGLVDQGDGESALLPCYYTLRSKSVTPSINFCLVDEDVSWNGLVSELAAAGRPSGRIAAWIE